MEGIHLQAALASCRYHPVSIDLDRRVVWFAELEREGYRRAGFLVRGLAPMGTERYAFNLDDVLLRDMSLPVGRARCHHIFISAECCSTLLARLLDGVRGCLVLKEPTVLGQLSMMRYRPGTAEMQAERDKEWKTWATLGMRLLARTFDPDQTVIVKAADVCNTMPDILLANDPLSKAVLLSVPLRTFIFSVLKDEGRKDWTRKRAAFWQDTLTLFPALSGLAVAELDDAQRAAYLWLITAALWDRFRKGVAPDRVMPLDGEEVSETPGLALKKVAGFFGFPLDETEVTGIVADPVLAQHSKHPGRPYDAVARRRDRETWEKQFGEQADRAIEWATPIRERLELAGVSFGSMAGEAQERQCGCGSRRKCRDSERGAEEDRAPFVIREVSSAAADPA